MRPPIVAGNWKMHGSKDRVERFAAALQAADVDAGVQLLVFPPIAYLQGFAARLAGNGAELGAQDLHVEQEGAFTGEVSGTMIAELGGRWALTGHSERRQHQAESDALVAAKFAAALDAGLTPIVCVGETLAEREAGAAIDVVTRQLDAVVALVGAERLGLGVVAYEPVWAIGTGKTAAPDQAQEMHRAIRDRVRSAHDEATSRTLRILYGGSVKPDNAAGLFCQDDIDGALVGGASLEADSFLEIAAAAIVTT